MLDDFCPLSSCMLKPQSADCPLCRGWSCVFASVHIPVELPLRLRWTVRSSPCTPWRYVIYREIGSSDSINFRPEFKRLLKDIENDFYDAVVVMDYDRLSRGDKEDRARVEKILQQSNTLVVTPTRVYDLNDEDQELITDIEGVFARYEYRMIKKRFQRGKKIGARLGHWTNGPAPFPY
ncbi:recombinase family protein [Alicyclobacillus cycloheptanicus]|uniref:recombinase family protein n=1 Tax=Alicyclobacillus cycloheptanicus TaxID=1457 RepID=UPI0027D8F9BD|nr:recombinase family protein [Alicyclobacillus cycloheptanicus]